MSVSTVSILLCTRNRAAFLRETLASLAGVDVPPGILCELLVVDNASTDDTAQVAQQAALPFPVRVVREERRGLSHARNAGMAAARGDIFLWTDDDLRFPPHWIEGMTRPILSGAADVVAGGVRIPAHLTRPWLVPGHVGRLASTETIDPDNPEEMVGANMAFGRHVLEKVPAFDPELGAGALGQGEETLFAWQVREAGFRLAAALDVAVEHHFDPERITRAGLLDAAAKTGRTLGYLLWHWQHERPRFPHLRLFVCRVGLAAWRLTHPPRPDRADLGETDWLRRAALLEQYLQERKRPPRYERHGLLLKDRPAPPLPPAGEGAGG